MGARTAQTGIEAQPMKVALLNLKLRFAFVHALISGRETGQDTHPVPCQVKVRFSRTVSSVKLMKYQFRYPHAWELA